MSKLQDLQDLLRDETKWPEGFKWDYSLNTKCALGLAYETGLISADEMLDPAVFGLTDSEWGSIFQTPLSSSPYREMGYTKVTPHTVSIRIARHLNRQAKAA